MCKDQHGCRFLQKKIEEGKTGHLNLIFNEIKESISELMVDPFANYLVQKLLDFANVDQRTALIYKAAPDMANIGLNQHGTRALQKMIDLVTTDQQIQHLTVALRGDVVRLIQDLNGNHVVQKCLNKLKPLEVQFIVDAVAESIMIVGRHRHGCCVIQRCIDHANTKQKNQLVSSITDESIPLVRDAYGNYVIQYVFDQADDAVNTSLARTFLGRIVTLSKEKFSSNVMEKAIRITNPQVKHEIVDEILQEPEFDKFVDHHFGNYVVQTALEYANVEDEQRLVDQIRPILHLLKNKPHGRRYASRISERDRRMNFPPSNGQMTPQSHGVSVQPMAHTSGAGFNMTGQSGPTSMYPNHSSVPQNGGLNVNSMGSPSFGHPQFAGTNQSPAHLQYRPNFQFPGMGPMGGQAMPPMNGMNGMNPQFWAQFYGGGRGY